MTRAAKGARRRKPSATARVRRFWIAIVVLLAVFGIAGYALASWRGFRVTRIVVRGNAVVSRSQIVARAAISPRANIWFLNTRAITTRIDAIPDVLASQVHRYLPNNLIVDVTERVPFARVASVGGVGVVDATLRVLSGEHGSAQLPLLYAAHPTALKPGSFLTEPGLTALVDDERLLKRASLAPRELRYDRFHELVVTLPSGVRVLLGDRTHLKRKVALIKPILNQLAHNGRHISALDLRAPTAPVVVYR